jgi:SAM-dependent methyltransferase
MRENEYARELDAALRPEPWCIDEVRYDGEVFEMRGWALPPAGRHELVTFSLNGVEFTEVAYPLARADIGEVFWYKAGAERAAFDCRMRVPREAAFADGYATLKCVSRETGQSFSERYDWYYPDDSGLPELPDAARRQRVAGNPSESVFRLEGFTTFTKLDRALRRVAGKGLGDFPRVLDWGCGCGRVTRYFKTLPSVSLTGVDIDADNLAWSRAHLGFGEFQQAPLHPPTGLALSAFDLAIGISVFSHLKEREQVEWLYELGRVARPGALLLMSVLGAATVARSRWGAAQWEAWRKAGMFAVSNNSDLRGHIAEDDYYVSTYLTPEYIRQSWSRFFEVLDIIPAYVGNQQDLVVLRKPA